MHILLFLRDLQPFAVAVRDEGTFGILGGFKGRRVHVGRFTVSWLSSIGSINRQSLIVFAKIDGVLWNSRQIIKGALAHVPSHLRIAGSEVIEISLGSRSLDSGFEVSGVVAVGFKRLEGRFAGVAL